MREMLDQRQKQVFDSEASVIVVRGVPNSGKTYLGVIEARSFIFRSAVLWVDSNHPYGAGAVALKKSLDWHDHKRLHLAPPTRAGLENQRGREYALIVFDGVESMTNHDLSRALAFVTLQKQARVLFLGAPTMRYPMLDTMNILYEWAAQQPSWATFDWTTQR